MAWNRDEKLSTKDYLIYKHSFLDKEIKVEIEYTDNKHTRMRIKDQKLVLVAGKRTSFKKLLEFSDSKIWWMVFHLDDKKKSEIIHLDENYFYFLGKKVTYRFFGTALFFNFNNVPYVKQVNKASTIYDNLVKIIKQMFVDYLEVRQRHWEAIMNVPPHSIEVREKTTNWANHWGSMNRVIYSFASCPHEEYILDYLIVHELTHHFHHNHGKGFKEHIAKYIPDWKIRRKNMNLRIYADENKRLFAKTKQKKTI
ncbi:YgjP-like metallopeptidase domain-containing protein [Mycoplasmopsis agassizii]|nr:YgjP-like metallopeptidase domain-containing protein [Mycoplasmopsis agassizii]